MQHVADDDDALPVEIAERVAQRVRAEEALRRVGVPTVAGVDHRGLGPFGDEVRGPRGGVAHHDHVPAECLEGANGVVERLALLDGRSARRDVRHIRG